MSKTYKLFYSWQSDEKVSRKILDAALELAKNDLKQKEGIDIEIDYSTLGKSGMPSIDQTILRKIDDCDLLLADITPVCKYQQQQSNGQQVTKEVPNPNVLIEMGYAMSSVGIDYVIAVAHRGKWEAHNLPFDIRNHSVYTFDSSSCNLTEQILSVIKFIRKHGGHRHLDKPYWVYWLTKTYRNLFHVKTAKPQWNIISEESTVFFKRRMAAAFPGERGLVEFTKPRDIHRHLSKLLEAPIRFEESEIGATDPVWYFRGGSALNIDSYTRLGWRRFKLGWDELKIRRIVAFVENGRYYSNYVYVEVDAQKPTKVNRKYYTKEHIEELKRSARSYVDEEYAIYKPCALYRKKVSKQEEDDGATKVFGRLVHMKREYIESRVRFLTNYNFVIAAKGSAFNNQDFTKTSEQFFDGLLDGTVTLEGFHKYMISFPKPDMNL